MSEDWRETSSKILNLALEIICLLTGETLPPVKPGDHVTIKEGRNRQKILAVINRMIELLTREVPIRCQDVAAYLSMEERKYLEGHEELYKTAMMEEQPTHGSRKRDPPERSSRPPCSWESTQEESEIPHHGQKYKAGKCYPLSPGARGIWSLLPIASRVEEEEAPVRAGQQHAVGAGTMVTIKEEEKEVPVRGGHRSIGETGLMVTIKEEVPREGSAEHGCDVVQRSEEHPHSSPEGEDLALESPEGEEACEDSSEDNSITIIIDAELFSADRSPDPDPRQSSPDGALGDTQGPGNRGHVKFSCSECGKYFTSSYAFQTHRRVHTGEQPFPCPECGRRFTRKENLRRHQKIHTGEKPYPCPQCGKSFSRKPYLEDHLRTHLGFPIKEHCRIGTPSGKRRVPPAIRPGGLYSRDPSTCPSVPTEPTLTEAITMSGGAGELGNDLFACSECGEGFSWMSDLQEHWQTHTRKAPFSCFVCKESFLEEARLLQHQELHTIQRRFSCAECGMRFVDQSGLNKHQRVHAGKKSFSCPECGKRFLCKSEVVTHQLLHASQKSCEESGRSYTAESGLVQGDHAVVKPFSCSDCGKTFPRECQLLMHLKNHTGDKPFSCLECGKQFSVKGTLNRHIRHHTVGNMMTCLVCGKRCRDTTDLAIHQRSHTGERPFSCTECGIRFTKKSSLVMHNRLHTGEKPFSCTECNFRCIRKFDLTLHLRTHTGEKPFSCLKCGRAFHRKSSLHAHQRYCPQ